MSTRSLDGSEKPGPVAAVRRSRWLMPAAAAAVVAALITTPLWWGDRAEDGPGGSASENPAEAAPAALPANEAGDRPILDAPGWRIKGVEVDPEHGGSMFYQRGERTVELMWVPAAEYESYLMDREHITTPPSAGEPVTVLGLPSRMWAYSADDHTMMRPVEAGYWLEVRGSGMDKDRYLRLLGALRLVGDAGFEAALPESYVGSDGAEGAVAEILDGIGTVTDQVLPEGLDPAEITSTQVDPYHLGADVAGTVACAWLDEFGAAQTSGDTARAAAAVEVLSTARRWPVLLDMQARGKYPDILWGYAAMTAQGQLPPGYQAGLGCD